MRAVLAVLLMFGMVSLAAPADKKFGIVRVFFSQIEDGPPVASDYQFLPGETIYFSCQAEGYKKVEKNDKQEMFVSYQVEVADSRGVLLQPRQSDKIQT